MTKHYTSPDTIAGTIVPASLATLTIITATFAVINTTTATSTPELILPFLAPALILTLLIVFYLYRSHYITIHQDALEIYRTANTITLKYTDIKKIELLNDNDMRGTIRTLGNGGIYGYTGKFYNRKFGTMTWYCTKRKNYILIELNNLKKIVFTPDNPKEVLTDLRNNVPSSVAIHTVTT